MDPELVWVAKDVDGRPVKYSQSNYERHQPKHPEIVEYIQQAKQTVEAPDLIVEEDNGAYSFYRMGLGGGKFAGVTFG